MFKTTTIGTPNFRFYDLSTEDLNKAYVSEGIKIILDLTNDLTDDDKLSRVEVLRNFLELVYINDRKNIDLSCNLVSQRHFIVKAFNSSFIDTFKTLIFCKEKTESFKLDDVIIEGRYFLDTSRRYLTWEIAVKAKDRLIPVYQTIETIKSKFK